MLQSLHGQLADVCVAFVILTISHHHHLPSNHLRIADILVASSMFLFFDSIIQNYFTGIKIVYINYGFFLQLPIYIYTCILENTVGKYIFSEYKKCFGILNASQCEVNWQGSTFSQGTEHRIGGFSENSVLSEHYLSINSFTHEGGEVNVSIKSDVQQRY